jgi:hypothetical protein
MDNYLSSTNQNTNYGGASIGLTFQNPSNNAVYELICSVNISNLGSRNATNASILYEQPYISTYEVVNGVYISRILFNVWQINPNWGEYTSTYSNPPIVLQQIESNWNDQNVNYVTVPVTSVYNTAVLNGEGIISFKVNSTFPYVNIYMSGTAQTENQPYMLVTY